MKQKNSLDKILIEFSMLIVIFSTITTFLNGLNWMQGVLFVLFQIGVILFPGMAVLFLLQLKIKTEVEFVAVSYAMGYVVNIILYYLLIPFKLQNAMWLTAIILALASIILFLKRRNQLELLEDKSGKIICGILIIAMLTIEQFAYSGANLLPPKANENIYYNDLLYWIGNTISLIKQYPPIDFRNYDMPYNYHYFSSIQMGVICLTTGLRPIIVGLCYSFVQPVILLATGSYCLFRKCTAKKALIVLGIVGLLFTSGIEEVSNITYIAHLFLGQFGFDVGVGISLFILYFFLGQYQKKKFDIKIAIMVIVLFTILVGTKSPNAVVIICTVGIMCIGWLFGKDYKKAFIYGISILVSFILMYLFVCNMNGYAGGDATVVFQAKAIYDNEPLATVRQYFINLQELHIPRFILEILFAGFFSGITNSFVFGLFWLCILWKVVRIKTIKLLDISCVLATLCAIGLTLYIRMRGTSQMYFIMAVYPITLLFIIRTFDEISYAHTKKSTRIWMGIIVITLLVSGNIFWYRGWQGYITLNVKEYFIDGIQNYAESDTIRVKSSERYEIDSTYKSTYTNREMYEAYEYIRENTDQSSVLASNRDTLSIGVFAERYVIKDEVTEELFENNNYDKIEELKSRGVGYLIQTKDREFSTSADFRLPEQYGKISFDNNSICVWRIK